MSARVAVLISGSGSNLQALIDAAAAPNYPGKIALVLSNKADAYGLERAKAASIPTVTLSHKDYADRAAFDAAIQHALEEHKIDYVALAGFMRILTPGFTERWYGKMLNIHPTLLPSFKGMHTHQEALDTGVKIHGCTVHFVVPEMDSGPIVIQAAVPVLPDDNAQTLGERVLGAEHQIYAYALKCLLDGTLKLKDGKVVKSKQAVHEYALFNPLPNIVE